MYSRMNIDFKISGTGDKTIRIENEAILIKKPQNNENIKIEEIIEENK